MCLCLCGSLRYVSVRFGVTIEHRRWFWSSHFPSWLSPPHPPLCLPPPPPLPAPAPPAPPALYSLCVSDTVCYMSRMPECSVPTSAGTGDVWSIPLSPGNRHVRSPPPGAGAGAEGREWVETSSFFIFFFQLSVYKQTRTRSHTRTQYEALACLCYLL